jgi:undecaprenyl-diphosphatase
VGIARLPVIPRSRGVVAALVRRDCQLFVAVSRAKTPWLDATLRGLGPIAVTSLLVNRGIKRVVRRPRPSFRNVPAVRQVKVAAQTTSFPSGHAGSAPAFVSGVASELAPAGPPLAVLAAAVGVSREYVGVHYPLDVLVGAGIGAGVGQLTRRVWPVLPQRAERRPAEHRSPSRRAQPRRPRRRGRRQPRVGIRA